MREVFQSPIPRETIRKPNLQYYLPTIISINNPPFISSSEIEEVVAEAAAVDTTQVAVKSTIDGNVELDSAAQILPTSASKIKINITKTVIPAKETSSSGEKKQPEAVAEPAPAKPLIAAAVKSSLQGKKLSILPTVEKGHELSGLCSIM